MTARGGRGGFALVLVLWLLVVLGAAAVEFHAAARADRGLVAGARATTHARWAARAALAHLLEQTERELLRPAAPTLPHAPRAAAGDTLLPPLRLDAPGARVDATVLDSRGRLHLGLADAPQLARLAAAAGIAPQQAAAIAAALLRWRASAGTPGRMAELRQVPGIGAAQYRRLAPHLTLQGDGRINVNTASIPVLLTLPGMDPFAARQLAARRRGAPFANVYEVLEAMPGAARARAQDAMPELLSRVAFGPRTIEVVVRAAAGGSPARAELHAVLLLEGGTRLSVQRLTER